MIRYTALVFTLLFLAFLTPLAAAHGGGHVIPYPGPSGTVPPIMRPPVTPPPPGPTGPTTPPGPTGPITPPVPGPTPTPPISPSPSGASAPSRGAVVGGAAGVSRSPNRNASSGGFETWEFWWSFNKEFYLNLKRKLFQTQDVTESMGFFCGRRLAGKKFATFRDTDRPTPEFVRRYLVPQLRTALRSPHPDVRDSACIALGKTGNAEDVKALIPCLKDGSSSVRKAAVVGLGLLRARESVRPLVDILEASPAGRRLRGNRRPEDDMRAWAAAGLALVGDDENTTVQSVLMKYASRTSETRNVRVNAVVALGVLSCERNSMDTRRDFLKRIASASQDDAFVRANAVTALGRLSQRVPGATNPRTVTFLLGLARNDRTNHVRRSALTALGLTQPDGKKRALVLQTLHRHMTNGKTTGERNFAALALGQFGGEEAFHILRPVVIRGRDRTTAFAALGLGILCERWREDPKRAALLDRGLGALRSGFQKARNPSFKGGLAIALGIARDAGAGEAMLTALKKHNDEKLRGYLAIALGMVNYTPSIEYLLGVLDHSENCPLLRQQTAIALGLMGNREVSRRLVKSFQDDVSGFVQASATQALGYIGDRKAIRLLTDMLDDSRVKFLTRGFVCVALGNIGEDEPIPVLAHFFRDLNWMAGTASIMELHRIM